MSGLGAGPVPTGTGGPWMNSCWGRAVIVQSDVAELRSIGGASRHARKGCFCSFNRCCGLFKTSKTGQVNQNGHSHESKYCGSCDHPRWHHPPGGQTNFSRINTCFDNLEIFTAHSPPPLSCISYALVQATVGVGTVIIVYVILITYKM